VLIEWIVNELTKKTDVGTVCKQILIDTKLKTGKRGQKHLTGRSLLRRQGFALDCSAI
jgi:hypothetical protein